jgi:glucosamine--fructose-6-phosphate aminotransferase (isomerizing)
VGSGYGVPVARELALKVNEATYLHAEGFAAGEFRHGSAALLEAGTALCGIVDEASRDLVERPLSEAARSGALRFAIGAGPAPEGVPVLGPLTAEAFNTLGWLVTGQLLALYVGRARGIDGDAPRGLSKFLS